MTTTAISLIIICLVILFALGRKGLIEARRPGRKQDKAYEDQYRERVNYKYPKL
jgi:hypothetical protein